MKRIKQKKNPHDDYENSLKVRKARKLAEQLTGTNNLDYIDIGNESEIFKFRQGNHQYIIKIFNYPLIKRIIEYFQVLSKEKLIPRIYEITEKYVIMDFIEGESLNDIIFDKKAKKRATELLSKIIKELKRWHSKGFAHGDLHEENIIITKDKAVFIDPNINSPKDPDHLIEEDLDRISNLEWMIRNNKFGGGFL